MTPAPDAFGMSGPDELTGDGENAVTANVPEPRAVLELAEEQYKFGRGPLLCRVVRVIAPVIFDDVLWWHVQGECAGGTRENHGGWQDRELYVVDSAVPVSAGVRRPHGDRP